MENKTTQSENWMFDKVKATCNEELDKDQLINKLAVQKIDYGLMMLAQSLSDTHNLSKEAREKYFIKMAIKLKNLIDGINGVICTSTKKDMNVFGYSLKKSVRVFKSSDNVLTAEFITLHGMVADIPIITNAFGKTPEQFIDEINKQNQQ